MGLFNLLNAELICLSCGKNVFSDIELHFGDVSNMASYQIGDAYTWRKNKAIQNGGRPPNGNLKGEGYMECPNCEKDFFVTVIIQNDVIIRVEIDKNKKGYKTLKK